MEQLRQTTEALNHVSSVLLESYRAITDNSENITSSSTGYVEQMTSLNRNIAGLNTIYEIQLKSISSQLYRDRVNQALEAGQRTVKASGKTNQMSVADAAFRAMQYEAFSKAVKQEQTDRKSGKDAVHYSNIAEADQHPMTTQGNTSASTNYLSFLEDTLSKGEAMDCLFRLY